MRRHDDDNTAPSPLRSAAQRWNVKMRLRCAALSARADDNEPIKEMKQNAHPTHTTQA
jgi:hypothetical protein